MSYDVIVVGGGHNGLTSAAYLAQAGKRVLVLEARDVVGGLAWTREMPNAPGYLVNPCSVEFLLTGVEPSVDHQLNLERYGLRWVYPQTLLTWLSPEDDGSLTIWKDRDKTVREIAHYSKRDARRYEQLADEVTAALKTVLPYLQGQPLRPKPGTIVEVIKQAFKHRRNLPRGARVMVSSLETVLDEYFERDEIKAPLAAYALGSFGPLQEPGSGLHMSLLTGLHEWGVRHPVGGTGAFTQALSRCVEAHGGTVITGAKVKQIETHGGRVRGVSLLDGREFKADEVIAAVDPITLMTKLLDPADVPDDAMSEVKGIQSLRNNQYTFKVDIALDRHPNLDRYGRKDEYADGVFSALALAPDLEYVKRSAAEATMGTFSDTIPLETIMCSNHDRTLVPPGSKGETFYIYAFNTPVELAGGQPWADREQEYIDNVLDHCAQYMPGFRDSIVDIVTTNPTQFEERYHVHKGNYEHADVTLAQMGPWRPIPSLAGYRTPVKGLWHSGSGAFPMSFLSGWPGRNTANAVLRKGRYRRAITQRVRRPAELPAAPSEPLSSTGDPRNARELTRVD